MDNHAYKELKVLLLLLSFGTTFSASIFGLNLGSLKDTAVNNIEQVPKFLNRVNLFNHYKQQSAEKSPIAFQNNREVADNERISLPKYEDQQNWGLNDPASFLNNRGNNGYNGYKITFSPSPSKYSQTQESSSNSPISFVDNLGITNYNSNENTLNPTTNKEQQGYLFAPTTSHFINKVTPGNNLNYAGNHVNVNSRGSFYDGVENSKPLLPEKHKKNNPADECLSEHEVTSGADFTSSNDYSTTTDYDLTTTDEPLNRIGAPPAVVASILG